MSFISNSNWANRNRQQPSAVARISRAVHRIAAERDEAWSEVRYLRSLLVRAKFNVTDPALKDEIDEALKEHP